MSDQALLTLQGIRKSFAGTEVLHGVSFDLREGEILGLVGENGAGKSTLMSIIGGLYPYDGGEMLLQGEPYRPQNPTDAGKAGIAFVHQEFSLFTNLSVADNLYVDNYPKKAFSRIDRQRLRERADYYIKLFHLNISHKNKVEELPMGIRQILEISKALEKNPRILIFDEPTTSLSKTEKDYLFEVIGKLKEQKISIIYISHILDDVISLCDRAVVLRDGNSVGQEDMSALDKKTMIKLMVGRDLNQVYPSVEKTIGEPVYQVESFARNENTAPVDFQIHKGEIVGMFGLLGAGRTELLNSLYGAEPHLSGQVTINGQALESLSPIRCIERGVAYITENRRQEGLIVNKPVSENLVLVTLRQMLKPLKVIDKKKERAMVKDLVERFSIRTADPDTQMARNLSGGNQQKVVIAKWCVSDPAVFFMDEPTRGVDVGAKFEIYTYINEMAKAGCGILIVSSEMEELMGMCDRILVMQQQRIVADIPKDRYNSESIIQYALEGELENAQ